MSQALSAKVAVKYLFAKKRHGAVGIITGISVCGVAVATAALVCVLSVFNGFHNLFSTTSSLLSADAVVSSVKGAFIENPDSVISVLENLKEVKRATPVIEQQALAVCHGHVMPVNVRGVVQDNFAEMTEIKKTIAPDGRYLLKEASTDEDGDYIDDYYAVISSGVAIRVDTHPGTTDQFTLFAPRRIGQINLANPAASFVRNDVKVSGVYQTRRANVDKDYVIVDIDLARELFLMDEEITSIDIEGEEGVDNDNLALAIKKVLPNNLKVKTQLETQQTDYRMVAIEKWITFLLLAFILLIASFNIISSLSMLVIEKEDNMRTFRTMGFTKKQVGSVFWWESIFITGLGGGIGIICGVILCLLQEHFGFIKLNGDESTLIVSAYPVAVEATDILIVMIPLIIIGLITAQITSRFARSRITI